MGEHAEWTEGHERTGLRELPLSTTGPQITSSGAAYAAFANAVKARVVAASPRRPVTPGDRTEPQGRASAESVTGPRSPDGGG
jgi:hypothetical protein